VNIVPSFRWYNPAKILSHLSEKDLIELMEGGEHSTFSSVESIRICTKISRTMEEILTRFETGDLRPDASEAHRPRASRRRPPPTKTDPSLTRKPAKKAATRKKSSAGKKTATASKKASKSSPEGDQGSRAAA
jgi:NTE family protein